MENMLLTSGRFVPMPAEDARRMENMERYLLQLSDELELLLIKLRDETAQVKERLTLLEAATASAVMVSAAVGAETEGMLRDDHS